MNESPTAESSVESKPKNNNRLWVLVCVLAIVGIFAWPTLRRAYRNVPPEDIAKAHGIWGASWDDASKMSLQTGKPILIDFTADWCGPCQVLNEEIFPQPEVLDAITSKFIPLRADISNSSSPGTPLGEKYQISAIPTLLIVDAKGNVLDKQVGLPSASSLRSWLNKNAGSTSSRDAATNDSSHGLPSGPVHASQVDPPPLAANVAAGL